MNKGIILILIMFLITPLVFAINISSSVPYSEDVSSIVIQQSLQTRNELKSYFDKGFNRFLADATFKAQTFLDENFAQLDSMIKSEVQKYYIKILIGLVAGLFFSAMLIYFVILSVRKLINRKYVSERKVVLEWLEAHETEAVIMKETISEMRSFIDLLKGIKSKAEDNPIPKPPEEKK